MISVCLPNRHESLMGLSVKAQHQPLYLITQINNKNFFFNQEQKIEIKKKNNLAIITFDLSF